LLHLKYLKFCFDKVRQGFGPHLDFQGKGNP